MGMLGAEPEQNPVITHFTHPHHLEITTLPEKLQAECSGCGIRIFPGKAYYACKTCDFCLHGTCYDLPKKITHPVDQDHPLILIHSPSFSCNGCAKPGSGFAYNCNVCSKYYHSLCTLKPVEIVHGTHKHPLLLEFSPAYGGKGFRCDICRKPGGLNQWFYSCSGCGFDIHLDCTKAMPQPLGVQVSLNRVSSYSNGSLSPSDVHVTAQRSIPVNNMGPPTAASQFSPSGAVLSNQGSFQYTNTAPIYEMNNGVPMANNAFPVGSYAGNNQTVFLRPAGVPTTAVLQPNGSAVSYGTPMGAVPSQGGMMSGMQGMMINGVVAGIGQQLGQDMVQSLTHGLGDGSGSSGNNGGVSDIVGCWIGGSDYY